MSSYRFSEYIEKEEGQSAFEKLLKIFLELLLHTSGDVEEAFDWLEELDDEYGLTDEDYTLEDFRKDLEKMGYLGGDGKGGKMTSKTEQALRKRSLDQIFGKIRKDGFGNHQSPMPGRGDERTGINKPYTHGDDLNSIDYQASIKNAFINQGIENFSITENDLEVSEKEHLSQSATVLMIDISHSMILYGEDRITPAKKVAMALSEYVMRKYPKDFIDVVVFGNDAWQVEIEDLPYLKVGPYHTNTVAGLELAMDILRRRRVSNRQVFMITDGKPTCIIENGEYYQNSFGHDPKIINRTINLAIECRKLKIPITTFMIADDPYLRQFVEDFTEANQGKAYYAGLDGLGNYVFDIYKNNKRRT